jgi:hypothetical protein
MFRDGNAEAASSDNVRVPGREDKEEEKGNDKNK